MKMCASVWFSKGVATRRLFLWRTGISFVALSTQPFVVLGAHVGLTLTIALLSAHITTSNLLEGVYEHHLDSFEPNEASMPSVWCDIL